MSSEAKKVNTIEAINLAIDDAIPYPDEEFSYPAEIAALKERRHLRFDGTMGLDPEEWLATPER